MGAETGEDSAGDGASPTGSPGEASWTGAESSTEPSTMASSTSFISTAGGWSASPEVTTSVEDVDGASLPSAGVGTESPEESTTVVGK